MNTRENLTPADLAMFARLRIDPDLLARAGVHRVTDREARDEFGLNRTGNNSGIVFPYVDAEGRRHTCRLRRDHPDIEDGKLVRKYLAPYGDRRHLYIVRSFLGFHYPSCARRGREVCTGIEME
jgi:hypothetical protein